MITQNGLKPVFLVFYSVSLFMYFVTLNFVNTHIHTHKKELRKHLLVMIKIHTKVLVLKSIANVPIFSNT